MLGFEMPRFPTPPARLEAEVVHERGPSATQHYAEIRAFTVSGRPLLVQRVQALATGDGLTVSAAPALTPARPLLYHGATAGGADMPQSRRRVRTSGYGLAVAALLLAGLPAAAGADVVFTRFAIPTPASEPEGITVGPDGALWFVEYAGNKIGRITTAGDITEFTLPAAGSQPVGIVAGPDGALWFTENGADQIGRITTTGDITEFPLPPSTEPFGIAVGSDGALWFTEKGTDRIGRITVGGDVTGFPIPTPASNPNFIVSGPDGALWFTEGANQIGRITTAGDVTEFPTPPVSGLENITVGPDGALWFSLNGVSRIGRLTTEGVLTEFPLPPGAGPAGIVTGPDGALWFAEASGERIGRITTAGAVTEYPVPPPGETEPVRMVVGPDGAIWFTGFDGSAIWRLGVDAPQPTVALALNQAAFAVGEALRANVTVANPGVEGLVDVLFGVLPPPEAGPGLGCPAQDAIAWRTPSPGRS
ncbi:MAG: virginiamycin B lyase family protein [Candidatus Rokuibacteriota bacterium]